jgi:hypothetical protein
MFGIDAIFSTGLLNDLVKYSTSQSEHLQRRKAERIYNRCLLTGHTTIAERIKTKYKLPLVVKSDLAIAMGMALMAQNQK